MDAVDTRSPTEACHACGYANPPGAHVCSLCAALLPPKRATGGARRTIAQAAGQAPFLGTDSMSFPVAAKAGWGPWRVLGLGALLAPLFLLPLAQRMGWFLGSLVHEIGHCVFSWLFGQPAFPAIRLDGHAAAIHREQQIGLVVLVALALAACVYLARRRPRLRVVAVAALVAYPFLALTDAREVLHLLGGHLGELAFAGVFFYRALSGGFTSSVAERVTYALCAWFLVGRNVMLTMGLVTSAGARAKYAASGSFGLTNDYIRVARDHLGWSLEGVAGLMCLVALATLPVALLVWSRIELRPRRV